MFSFFQINSAALLLFTVFTDTPGNESLFAAGVKAGGLRGLSCQILHRSLCCKPGYAKKPTDTAKVAIKTEKPASFGVFFNNGAILALPKSDTFFS